MTERMNEGAEELVPGMIVKEVEEISFDGVPLPEPEEDSPKSDERMAAELKTNVVEIANYARNRSVSEKVMRAADAATLATVLAFGQPKS